MQASMTVRAGRRAQTPTLPRRVRKFISRNAETIVVTVIFLMGLAVGVLLANGAHWLSDRNAMNDYGRELRYAEYEVRSGDTYWSIAKDLFVLNPEFTDIRQYVNLLQKTNRSFDYIRQGQTILIPYYADPDTGLDAVIQAYEKYIKPEE